MFEAWREAVFLLFQNCKLEGPAGTSTSLLDVLAHVLGSPTARVIAVKLERCPGRHDRDCKASALRVPLSWLYLPRMRDGPVLHRHH